MAEFCFATEQERVIYLKEQVQCLLSSREVRIERRVWNKEKTKPQEQENARTARTTQYAEPNMQS
jgi:hypothetical protein